VGTLFFLSGFAGLTYQVLWLRELGLLLGNTAHAAAAVAAIFFLGLGTGSAFFGERAKRWVRPLQVYGWLELAVSASALGSFGLLPIHHELYPFVFERFGEAPGALLSVKLLLALTLLFPPAFFMGGTLPVVTAVIMERSSVGLLGRRVPWFYGLNTFGAAAGTVAAGFFLPRWMGMTNAYWLAVATTTILGVAACLAGRRGGAGGAAGGDGGDGSAPSHGGGSRAGEGEGPPGGEEDPVTGAWSAAVTEGRRRLRPRLPPAVAGLAFFSGFGALALEVLWTRMFAQTLHNSVYTYAAILATFLVALAAGAWVAAVLVRRLGDRAAAALPWLLLAAGALVLVSPQCFHHFGSERGGYLGESEDWPAYLRLVFSATGMSFFPAAVALGVIFPFLMKLAEAAAGRDPARVVGRLAALNTAGAVAGSLAAGFVLLEWLGLWSSIRLVAVIYLLLVFAFAGGARRRTAGEAAIPWRRKPGAALAGGGALLAGVPALDPGSLPVVPYDPVGRAESLLWAEEGAGATVAVVRREDSLRIKVNNFYALGSTAAAANERFQAHLPSLIHPEPRRVFFLGMGTGITAGGALDFDGVERVTVAESLPGVVEASRRFFGPWVTGLHHDDRVRVVVEDGRHWLAATRERYDLIVSDLFIPWRSGVGSLYTLEHYEKARDRLAPGGYYAQWLPLYQLTEAQFADIAHTMGRAFPHLTVWRGDFYADEPIVCLVGAAEPRALDWPGFEERSLDLTRAIGANPLESMGPVATHLAHYAGNLGEAGDFFADARLNTDDYPHVEYEAPIAHRGQKAGRVEWMTGERLIAFFDRLHEAAPPETDPWLAPGGREAVLLARAGHALHELKVAEAHGSDEEEAAALRIFAERLREVNAYSAGGDRP